MRAFLATLALAGALIPLAPAHSDQPPARVAQMARDVTDAVRIQRKAREHTHRRDHSRTCEGRR